MSGNFLLVEKYRPKTIQDCILPKNIKDTFQGFVDSGQVPNLLLAGGPGMGKTTVAKALCEQVGYDWMMINGSEESGIDVLRTKIRNYASTVSLYSDRKCIIIDEADHLNPNSTQPALRAAIEEFSDKCSFILTCNHRNKLHSAIQSRFATIDFKFKSEESAALAKAYHTRVMEILEKENIQADADVIAEIIIRYYPDFRKVLSQIQRFGSSGKIDKGILGQIADVNLKVLVGHLRNKEWHEARKWVAKNQDADYSRIFRNIYDEMYDILEKESIPQAVLLIAKYQYQAAFVADHEVNLMAFLTELMADCNFKEE